MRSRWLALPILALTVLSNGCAGVSEESTAAASESGLTAQQAAHADAMSSEANGKIAIASNGVISIASPSGGVARLGPASVAVNALQYDGANVFYAGRRTATEVSVVRMSATGQETVLANLPSQAKEGDLVGMDGDALYVLAASDYFYASRQLYRVSKSTGAVEDVATNGMGGSRNFPDVIACAAGNGTALCSLYSDSSCGDQCGSVRLFKAGETSPHVIRLADGMYVAPIALRFAGPDLYFASKRGLYKLPNADPDVPAQTICTFGERVLSIGAGTPLAAVPDAGFEVSPAGFLVPVWDGERHGRVARVDSQCHLTNVSPLSSGATGVNLQLGTSPVGLIRAAGNSFYWFDRISDEHDFKLLLTSP